MSAILMGAVLNCGPGKGSLRYALVAIADNADDYGFACPSLETIAAKVCCDVRTAIRLVQKLEREGWMRVVRDALYGKGNVYFLDIARLGIVVDGKMRRSKLHLEVARQLEGKLPGSGLPDPGWRGNVYQSSVDEGSDGHSSRDNLSCVKTAARENSRDNPQGSHVTKTADSRDKKPLAIWKNHQEPSKNLNTPLPPSQAKGVCEFQRDLDEASAKVLRECRVSDPRMRRVVRAAIDAECRRSDEDAIPNDVAELMVLAWKKYRDHADLLRCVAGFRRFIAMGMWGDASTWHWDQTRVDAAKHARVGT